MFSEIPRPADISNQEITTADIKATTTLAASTSDNAIQKVQITTFQDVEQPAVAITPMAQNTTSIAHFDTTFNIKEFLQRPVKLEHFQLSVGSKYKLNEFTTTDFQVPVRSYKLPEDVLKKGGKMDKVRNHQYFKADIKVKLVLNTSPFVAGRFYLTYSPYEDTISEARQQKWASRAGVTAYPGVEIDAQLDNSVEITIPFASYKESYVLTNYNEPFATLNLFSIVPIRGTTAGKGHIDIAVYAWFENIELNIPTSKVIDTTTIQDKECAIPPMIMQRADIGRKVEKLKKDNPTIYKYILNALGVKETVNGKMQLDSTNSKFKLAPTEQQYLLKQQEIARQQERRDAYYQRTYGRMQIQAEAGNGPISSIASAVGSIADVVSGVPIPVVSEIASTVGWVSDLVGNIASIFGWSKPNNMEPLTVIQNIPGKNYTHYDGVDQSVSLSLTNRNELDKLYNIFPSGADEMSLSYVCANPAIIKVQEWKSTAAAGEIFTSTPLMLIPVGIGSFSAQKLTELNSFYSKPTIFNPDNIYDKCVPGLENFAQYKIPYTAYRKGKGGSTRCDVYASEVRAKADTSKFLLSTAPCEYVSQLFKHWRATICFKISVVKTAFHTGRLEIFFDPGMYYFNLDRFISPKLNDYTSIDTSNNYKYILDLTNDTEITIKIPFVSEQLFLRTQGLNTGNRLPTPEDVMNSIIGSLVVRPLTNLMCPETVMEAVDIIVWKWAEDVVLTCPISAGSSDLSIYDKDSTMQPPNIYTGDIDYKILRTLKVDNKDMECVSGSMQINIGNKAEGNSITFFNTINIEQENMRACKNASGERLVNLRPLLRVFRFFRKLNSLNITLNPQEDDDKTTPDYISYLSYMFRFFRGGFRYKIIHDGKQCESTLVENDGDSTILAPSHITFPQLNPMHEISIPYYAKFRKLPISSTTGIMQARVKGDGKKTTILRSGNDDLTFGWLMGTPQLTPGGGTITWLSLERTDYYTNQPNCFSYPDSVDPNDTYATKTVAKVVEETSFQRNKRDIGDIKFPNSGESFLASLNEG